MKVKRNRLTCAVSCCEGLRNWPPATTLHTRVNPVTGIHRAQADEAGRIQAAVRT